MTDKELDNYIKTVNPNFDSHIEKETIEMSNEYYNLLEEKMARLINENQELKKQLKPNYYVKGLEGTLKEYQQEMNNVANQQKEFIKYLEDEIENSTFLKPSLKMILLKYKSIIEKGDVR